MFCGKDGFTNKTTNWQKWSFFTLYTDKKAYVYVCKGYTGA